jgi:HK97 family phage major capsid protein
MKLTIKEADTLAEKYHELPEGAEVVDEKGEAVDYKITIKEKKMENIEVVKEHIQAPKPVTFKTVWEALKTKGKVRVLSTKTQLTGEFNADDAGDFAQGTAFITDDILPAQIPAFSDQLVSMCNKVPISQASFRLLTFAAGDSYAYITKNYGGSFFNNQGTLVSPSGVATAYSTITSGLSIPLKTYLGNVQVTEELLEDLPSFQTQITDVLSKELSAQLQKEAIITISGSPSKVLQTRTTSGAIVAADLWNMYSRAIKGDPNPRYAWLVSPSANAAIQQLRDYNTGLGAYITQSDENGMPFVKILNLPVVENWYQPSIGTFADVMLVDMNTVVCGIRGTMAPTVRVNPWLLFEYNASVLQVKVRAGFGSRYQTSITRNSFTQSNIVCLSGTSGT